MLQRILEKITNWAINEEYISQEQRNEYLYGFTVITNIIVSDITMLIIGLTMHMIWECIGFWLVYKILRKYCGGYHFDTSFKCYLSSCILCPIVLLCLKYMPYNIILWSIITATSVILLCILSPIAAINKPLDEKETVVFGRAAKILTILAFVGYIIMLGMHFDMVAKIISLAIVWVTLFAIAGAIQSHKIKSI